MLKVQKCNNNPQKFYQQYFQIWWKEQVLVMERNLKLYLKKVEVFQNYGLVPGPIINNLFSKEWIDRYLGIVVLLDAEEVILKIKLSQKIIIKVMVINPMIQILLK